MKKLITQFKRGLRWNALEAFSYQAIVLTHQLCLYAAIGNERFGFAGTIFSLMYLSVSIGLMGFDSVIPSFFLAMTHSREAFKRYFFYPLLLQLMILSIIPFSLLIIHEPITTLFKTSLGCCPFSHSEWVMIGIIVVLEGLKKALRVLAQTAFYNRATTLIELTGVSIYVGLIWGSHACGVPLQPSIVFKPFLLQSLISVSALSVVIHRLYKGLARHEPILTDSYAVSSHTTLKPSIPHIIQERFCAYANHLAHLLFSGNFVVSFFAFTTGLNNAGVLKLANTITTFANVLLERIFGLTSGALLAHLKNKRESVKASAFKDATSRLYHALISVTIITLIVARPIIMRAASSHYTPAWLPFYFFITFMLFESVLITYERLFIVEGAAWYLGLINSGAALTAYSILYGMPIHTLALQLIIMLITRIIVFLLVSIRAYQLWQITFRVQFSQKLAIFYVILALSSFLLTRLL